MKADLAACFARAAQDVGCQSWAAQAEWVAADWQASQRQPSKQKESLTAALTKAQLATQCPEPYPDAWRTLAETHLGLARGADGQQRAQHVD